MSEKAIPCPRCGRPLAPSGVVTFDGRSQPVYQCDRCKVRAEVFDEPFEAALTFCLDGAGRPFDPASPGGSLPPEAP